MLKRDVPAVVVSNAFGDEERFRAFMSSTYHQASDEPGALELGGAVEDLFLHELLVRGAGRSEAICLTQMLGREKAHIPL